MTKRDELRPRGARIGLVIAEAIGVALLCALILLLVAFGVAREGRIWGWW